MGGLDPKDFINAPIARDKETRDAIQKIVDRLAKAGVDLDNLTYTPDDLFSYPSGFYFTSRNFQGISRAADSSSKLALDNVSMGVNDPWQIDTKQNPDELPKGARLVVGYTEVGALYPVHLDIDTTSKRCRVYISSIEHKVRRTANTMAKVIDKREEETYVRVTKRLMNLVPPIDIEKYIASNLVVKRTPLDGIDFMCTDVDALNKVLEDAKDSNGAKAFASGSKYESRDWAISLSFMATEGRGYREILRPGLPDGKASLPPQQTGREALDSARFSARFGDSTSGMLRFQALHCGVSAKGCNIHIDTMGFVIQDMLGNTIVDPDFLRHMIVELLWKTDLQGILADSTLDKVNFDISSSPLAYSTQIGVTVTIAQTKKYKFSLKGSCDASTGCGLHGGAADITGVFSVTGVLP